MTTGNPVHKQLPGIAVDCEKEGHCWHPGTAVSSLACCKCGKYLYTHVQVTFAKNENSSKTNLNKK